MISYMILCKVLCFENSKSKMGNSFWNRFTVFKTVKQFQKDLLSVYAAVVERGIRNW